LIGRRSIASLAIGASFCAMPIVASVAVKRAADRPKTIDVAIVKEPLSSAVKALEMYLPLRVQIVMSGDPLVTFRASHVSPEAALHAVALSAGATLTADDDHYSITSGPSVTIDVKDEDVHAILQSMKKQCGIRNLVIDPGVQGKGTFLFASVPCRTAFDVVLRTFDLASVDYGNSVVTVGTRKQ